MSAGDAIQDPVQMDVEVNGSPLDESALRLLSAGYVRRRLNAPAVCELVFDGGCEGLPGMGDSLVLTDPSWGQEIFGGKVTSVDAEYRRQTGASTRVRAYDRLHEVRQRRSVRASVDADLEALFSERLEGLGLVVESHSTSPKNPRVLQCGPDDLEFLRECAERAAQHFVLIGGVIHLFGSEGLGGVDTLDLHGDVETLSVMQNQVGACGAVHAMGWDARESERHLAFAFDVERDEDETREEHRGLDTITLASRAVASGDHALGLAQAAMDGIAARRTILRGETQLGRDVCVGRRLRVRGAVRDDEEVLVTEVVHEFDALRGHRVRFHSEPGRHAHLAPKEGAVRGIVSSVSADPNPRVQVRLPEHGDIESDFLQVGTLGAGDGRGLLLMPDVGDEVLVWMFDWTTSQGIVLTGLLGKDSAPLAAVSEARTRRVGWASAGGAEFVIDDVEGSVRLVCPGGSSLELGPKGVSLIAKGDLELSAAGETMELIASKVDFVRRA